MLLAVEDAHWIDPSTNEFLRDIVLRIHGAPVYVLMTHRPDWSPDWAKGLSHMTNVAVGRLTNQQIRLFIRSILGAVSDRLVDRIAERTDGVPLFVEELTRSILESGAEANEDIEIPDSLQGSLMARLDRLSATSREVAQVAAVIGREFDRGLLAQVAALEGLILDNALRQLLTAQLVVMGGTSQQSLLFRHALIQDAAYQSLLTRKQVHFHHAIADAIAQSHPDIATTQPELVARHYTEGRRDDLALPYWKKAGERALERCANYEAIDHFSNALALAERLPDGPQRDVETLPPGFGSPKPSPRRGGSKTPRRPPCDCRASSPSGRRRELVRVALGYDPRSSLSACRSTGLSLSSRGGGENCLRRRQATLRDSARLARAHLYLGDAEKSESYGRQGNELARRLGDRRSLFTVLANRFVVPWQVASSGDAQSRLSETSELVELSRSVSDDEMKGRAISMAAYVAAELGDRARLDRSLAALTELGEVRQRLNLRWDRAMERQCSRFWMGNSRTRKALRGKG